ncbi:MAG: flagellar hook-basal body complex protein FliE [Parvularculaceae bacterium]
MSIEGLRAAQTYAEVARLAANAPRTDAAADLLKPDFSRLLTSALSETTSALKGGVAAAAQVAAGEASLVDVVTAISAAEVALETAIAVRNRVIDAYQEIMRMPI